MLRELSIDELPQLFNILSGEMSVVGPRPVTDDELTRYGVSRSYYLRSRPGLTGLWQVSGRNDVSYERRVMLDRCYVTHWSFRSDVAIILKTIPAVVLAKGSY
jgi:exopolysaccharide production protein ExoY